MMYTPIKDIEFRTIDEFLNRLKRIFAPHHTANYCREALFIADVVGKSREYQGSPVLNKVEQVKELVRIDDYASEAKSHLETLSEKYADVFHVPTEKLSSTRIIEHAIETTDKIPVNVKQYRYPQTLRDEIHKQIDKMLKDGIIEHSAEGNKRWRLVIDYRKLNEKTKAHACRTLWIS